MNIEKISFLILKGLSDIGAIDSAFTVDAYQIRAMLNEMGHIPEEFPIQIVESGVFLLKGLDLVKVRRKIGVLSSISLTAKGVEALGTVTDESIDISHHLT